MIENKRFFKINLKYLNLLCFKYISHFLSISIEPTHVEIKSSIHDHISIEIEMAMAMVADVAFK